MVNAARPKSIRKVKGKSALWLDVIIILSAYIYLAFWSWFTDAELGALEIIYE